MSSSYEGRRKVAAITGAAGGIGSAVAARLIREEINVVLLDRPSEHLDSVIQHLDAGKQAVRVPVDVTDETSVRKAADAAAHHFGTIEYLVNCAGIESSSPLVSMTTEQWDAVVNVNLRGTFLACRAFLPAMIEQRFGSIVNFGSVAMTGHHPGTSHYTAAKAGVSALTAVLAREVGPDNINVNAVAPGMTATNMAAGVAKERGITLEEMSTSVARKTPLRRIGTGDDIAGVVAFLLSADARHITGRTLIVDGGLA